MSEHTTIEDMQEALLSFSRDYKLYSSELTLFLKAGVAGFDFLCEKLLHGNPQEELSALYMIAQTKWPDNYAIFKVMPKLLSFLERKEANTAKRDVMNILVRVTTRFEARIYLEILYELLFDEEAEVRMYAAFALKMLKDKQAVPLLSLLLNDEAILVSRMAKETLEAIDTPYARFLLEEWEKRR